MENEWKRVRIVGVHAIDAFEDCEVVGLTGRFKFQRETEKTYVSGHFLGDNGQKYYFCAVQVEEL